MAALAPSTRRTYNIGINKFYMFCKNFNCMPFPLNEEVLCLFVTNLAESVSFKTLKLYLSAVKFQNMELGFRDSMSKMTQLQLTLRGIKRTLGAHGSRKPRLPISIVTMRLLKRYIFMSKLTNHNKLMFWSACTLAFFGFLRSSEYVSTPLIESRLTSIIKYQFLLYLHQDNNLHDYFINTRLASRRKESNWVNRGLQN